MSGLRKTQVVLLTLMGAGTIGYFMPTCSSPRTTAGSASTRGSTTQGTGGYVSGHRTGFWPLFWGSGRSGTSVSSDSSRTGTASKNSSTVTRGGFGSSWSGSSSGT